MPPSWEVLMSGKKKCRILKEIRQKIADENDIPFVTHECRYQGKCSGTCPRCESELAYLEKQLAARAAAGKKIAVAALCAGMTFSVAGCSSLIPEKEPEEVTDLSGMIAEPEPENGDPDGNDPYVEGSENGDTEDEIIELSGEVAYPDDQDYADTAETAATADTCETAGTYATE